MEIPWYLEHNETHFLSTYKRAFVHIAAVIRSNKIMPLLPTYCICFALRSSFQRVWAVATNNYIQIIMLTREKIVRAVLSLLAENIILHCVYQIFLLKCIISISARPQTEHFLF